MMFTRIRGLSIFQKLLFWFVGLSIFVTFTSGYVHYIYARKIIEVSVRKELESSIEAAISYFDNKYAYRIQEDLTSMDLNDIEGQFKNLTKTNNNYLGFWFLAPDGEIKASVTKNKTGSEYKTIYDTPLNDLFYQEIVKLYNRLKPKETNAISFLNPTKYSKDYSFLIGISKHDPVTGTFSGVIILHADLTDYMDYLRHFRVFGKSLIWAVDREYNNLLAADDKELFSPDVLNKTITYNKECLLGTDRQSLMNIIFGAPPEIFSTQMKATVAITLGVAFSVILISAVISLFLSKQFSRPIIALVNTSLAIGKGNLEVQAPAAKGEIGLLAETINKMTADLKQTTVSRDYVERILQSMNESLFVLSPDGRIETVNRAATRILNMEERDLIRKPIGNILKKRSQSDETWFDNLSESDIIKTEEKILITKEGREIPVLFSSSVMKRNDEIQGIVCVAQDITDIKEAEQKLRNAFSKLKQTQEDLLRTERLAVVGETSGCVAHEVMNPITSIFTRVEQNISHWEGFNNNLEGCREIIEDWQKEYRSGTFIDYLNKKDDKGRSYGDEDFFLLEGLINSSQSFKKQRENDLKFINKQLQRVIKIINSLRDSARTERLVTRIDITKTIAESIEVLDDAFRKRGIEVKISSPASVPAVMGDESEMIQVFNNLLRNAMQSIEKKNEHEGMINIEISANNGNLEINLSDNGTGMSQEVQDKIFNFNFSTRSSNQGSGLGLGISRRFIRECGGDIILKESIEGIGTTFLITIPTTPLTPPLKGGTGEVDKKEEII